MFEVPKTPKHKEFVIPKERMNALEAGVQRAVNYLRGITVECEINQLLHDIELEKREKEKMLWSEVKTIMKEKTMKVYSSAHGRITVDAVKRKREIEAEMAEIREQRDALQTKLHRLFLEKDVCNNFVPFTFESEAAKDWVKTAASREKNIIYFDENSNTVLTAFICQDNSLFLGLSQTDTKDNVFMKIRVPENLLCKLGRDIRETFNF